MVRKPLITGIFAATIHLAVVGALAARIGLGIDPASARFWSLFLAIDFPVSVLWVLSGWVLTVLQPAIPDGSVNLYNLWVPGLIFGIGGTVWWFFVPTIIARIGRGPAAESRVSDQPADQPDLRLTQT